MTCNFKGGTLLNCILSESKVKSSKLNRVFCDRNWSVFKKKFVLVYSIYEPFCRCLANLTIFKKSMTVPLSLLTYYNRFFFFFVFVCISYEVFILKHWNSHSIPHHVIYDFYNFYNDKDVCYWSVVDKI